jgi:hypothetical protein
MTYATAPDGALWLFADTCIPAGWKETPYPQPEPPSCK